MYRENLQRIEVKGGILSPSELKQIIELIESLGIDYMHFGSRQDILFPYQAGQEEVIARYPQLKVENITTGTYQNISCSYLSADIFPSTNWLTGSTYLYILEQFRKPSKLEINIADPKQRLVPLFFGHLNFIASPEEDYWYLYIRFLDDEVQCFPVLIHTWDIALVARCITEFYESNQDVQELFQLVSEYKDVKNRNITQELNVPSSPFPYYEGMNRMGIDKYWLGLYWRNNRYNLVFLKALCDLCLEHKIGKVCITPWKSFIVKGIHAKYKLAWEKLLGKFGINVRHSLLEMNWHLPVNDQEALDLKRFLVRNFDQNDISTYGLTFGISGNYGIYFTSIVIETNPKPQVVKNFVVRPTYNVLYCKNFDPNTQEYLTYAQDVDKIELPGLLMELSQLYFQHLGENDTSSKEVKNFTDQKDDSMALEAFQCSNCFTVYDSAYGDSFAGILPGTLFEQLPADYVCPTCASPKSAFIKLENTNIEV